MSSIQNSRPNQLKIAASILPQVGFAPVAWILVLGHGSTAKADPVLIDFGNSSSFRGASQTGVDSNGLYWTSVWGGAYYSNLVDTSNSATSLGFGFSVPTSVGLGTDSFNGPSGATSAPITQTQIDAANIDASALGILGGSKASAFDYYVAKDGRFVIQNLNANETYNLTFFGSHKYNDVNTTDYAVYSDNTYGTSVGSTSLVVGVGPAHNTNTTATIAGPAPQTSNTLYVRFGANGYTQNGYINALSIVGYVPYNTGSTTTIATAKTYTGNTILGNSSTVNANVAGALGGGSSALQMNTGGGSLSLGASQTVTALIGSGNLALATGSNTLTLNTTGSTTFSVLTTSNGSFASNDYTGILSGSGTIDKTGSGTQILSGANTFSGTIKTSAGTLTLNHVDALKDAKLDTTYVGTGAVSFGIAGSNTYKLGGLFGNRAINMGTNSLDISTAGGSSFYDGVLSGSGSLTKSGAGTFTLRGNNSFTGSVTISAGTLQISDDGPANGGSIASSSGISNNGSLVYNLNSNDRTYANEISGSGSLTKTGTRTLTLSGTNSYLGATSVTRGNLVIDGSTSSSSAVSVAAGTASGTPVAKLSGSGTIGGNVSLTAESTTGFKNGGVLAPSAAASGTALDVGGTTTFGMGSIFEWNMSATNPASDPGNNTPNSGAYGQLAGSNTISGSDSVFKIVLGAGNAFTDAFWDTNKTWNNVFTGAGATNPLDSIFSSISGDGITFASNQGTVTGQGYFTLNGTSTLNWTAVPEPSTALAGLLLTAGLLRRRRA